MLVGKVDVRRLRSAGRVSWVAWFAALSCKDVCLLRVYILVDVAGVGADAT